MSEIIKMQNVVKEFRVLNRREGLKGSVKDLFSRNYKTIRAVDNISVIIAQGEIVGYLGPNGAGKSTTIKMMTGVLEPTSGQYGLAEMLHIRNAHEMHKRLVLYLDSGHSFGGHCRWWNPFAF